MASKNRLVNNDSQSVSCFGNSAQRCQAPYVRAVAKAIASGVRMTNDWVASQVGLSLKTSGQNLLVFLELLSVQTSMLSGVGRVPGNEHPYTIYTLG